MISVIESMPTGSAGLSARTKSVISPRFGIIFAAIHHTCTYSHEYWQMTPRNTQTFEKKFFFSREIGRFIAFAIRRLNDDLYLYSRLAILLSDWNAHFVESWLHPCWPSNQLGCTPPHCTVPVQRLYISCYLSVNKPVLSYLSSSLLPQWWPRPGCTLCIVHCTVVHTHPHSHVGSPQR